MKKLLRVFAPIALSLAASTAFASEVVESYDASVGELPEGVAVSPAGDIYVTLAGTGELRRLDGKTYAGETLANLPVGGGFLLGMAFDEDELYVALASFDAATSGIWHVDDDGVTERVVVFGGDEFPNDLTFDDGGNMFITESISGSVYRVPAGSTERELFIQDPLLVGDVAVSPVPFPIGANGIVYDDQADIVLVANSQVPGVIEIEDDCGAAGAVSVLSAGENLRGADGLSIDKRGDIIVVSNFNSTVSVIDRDTGVAEIIADQSDGLLFPSTVAFGQRGRDKRSLFVANFGFGAGPDAPVSILKIEYGEKSEKNPAGT